MNPEIYSVSVATLLLGFMVGAAIENAVTVCQLSKLKSSLQKAIDVMFEKDEEIDDLKEELDTLKTRYNQLSQAVETSWRALNVAKNLPPPVPVTRSEHYIDENEEAVQGFISPTTPATCEPSSTD